MVFDPIGTALLEQFGNAVYNEKDGDHPFSEHTDRNNTNHTGHCVGSKGIHSMIVVSKIGAREIHIVW